MVNILILIEDRLSMSYHKKIYYVPNYKCRVHKPRVPRGPTSQQWLGPTGNIADNAQLMGRPKYLNDRPEGRSNLRPGGLAEEERRPLSDSGPPLRPEHSLQSPARLWTASLTGRPGQSTTYDSDPTSLTRVYKRPCSLLFSD